MSSVGETLRRERLRTGLDLEKIARETKISTRTLELIEADQFEKLPGGVFARSFVRQYARVVGLDEEEMVRGLEKFLEPSPDPIPAMQEAVKQPEIRVPRVPRWDSAGSRLRSNSSLPALGLVVLVIVACSAAYTWWQKSGRALAPADSRQSTETAHAAKTPEPAEPAESVQAATATPGPTTPPTTTPVEAESRAPEPAAQRASGTVTADASGSALHIGLTAAEPTWVRAVANGKVVFSGVIQANETKDLSAADTVTLRIGNAGGVAISLNGRAIPAVGPKGQVRVVQLSPDGGVQVAPPAAKPQPDQAAAQQTRTL
jgi:cytoskeleton protein RodZ